jgi:hypothetical protein
VSLVDYARDTLTGTIEQCMDRLRAFASLGVEEVIVGAGSIPFSVFDWPQVELVADRLAPVARTL